MELQHINVKIYLKAGVFAPEKAIPVFHEWIREDAFPGELLIDVADYGHVPAGPGVMLVGHEAFYSLETGPEDRPGLLYNQRTARPGTNVDRLLHALFRAADAAGRLEKDTRLGGLRFDPGDLRLFVNDRAIAPNSRETFNATQEDVRAALAEYFGGSDFTLEYVEQDPRERFTVAVRASGVAVLPKR